MQLARPVLTWAQHMAKSKCVEPDNLAHPDWFGLSIWSIPSILGLITYHTYVDLSSACSWTHIYWVRQGSRPTVPWPQLLIELKYIGYSNLLDPRHIGLSIWLNPSILGLVTCWNHDALGSAFGWTHVYWVW